jgi:hypothetical protein
VVARSSSVLSFGLSCAIGVRSVGIRGCLWYLTFFTEKRYCIATEPLAVIQWIAREHAPLILSSSYEYKFVGFLRTYSNNPTWAWFFCSTYRLSKASAIVEFLE